MKPIILEWLYFQQVLLASSISQNNISFVIDFTSLQIWGTYLKPVKRVLKYDQNGEKIKVLPAFNQKLQMREISKGRRHSRRGGAQKTDFGFVCQTFCSVELFDQKC